MLSYNTVDTCLLLACLLTVSFTSAAGPTHSCVPKNTSVVFCEIVFGFCERLLCIFLFPLWFVCFAALFYLLLFS